jgi:hypothetical protein
MYITFSVGWIARHHDVGQDEIEGPAGPADADRLFSPAYSSKPLS